jgi:hypothetical protein
VLHSVPLECRSGRRIGTAHREEGRNFKFKEGEKLMPSLLQAHVCRCALECVHAWMCACIYCASISLNVHVRMYVRMYEYTGFQSLIPSSRPTSSWHCKTSSGSTRGNSIISLVPVFSNCSQRWWLKKYKIVVCINKTRNWKTVRSPSAGLFTVMEHRCY